MIKCYRLALILGICTGYIYLVLSAKTCTFRGTFLQKWIFALLDTYTKSNTKEANPYQCILKHTKAGVFNPIRPHLFYYVNPKAYDYNVIRVQIPEYQINQKTKYENQNEENKTSKEKYYHSKIINKDTSDVSIKDTFATSLNRFENLFYQTNFAKLTSISAPDRKVNGISFVQSGLFMYLVLIALSTEIDSSAKTEIENVLNIEEEAVEKIRTLKNIISQLPISNKILKFQWGSRLLVNVGLPLSSDFEEQVAKAMNLKITRLSGTETSEYLSSALNSMVEKDSGGTLHKTFDEDDFNDSVCSILVTTINIRARWRSAPTVLNGTRRFYDDIGVRKERSVRMIKINDIMRYANLAEWNAQAIEINYATPGLTLLLLIPNKTSLRGLAANVTKTNPQEISNKMSTMRISAILPLYTLRMTLLLPEKLRSMELTRLFDKGDNNTCENLTLTYAVQRLMFWSEAGRYAYKDDGLQWDETPEREIIVNRPYLFYVRWHNITLMNGNFVL